ncbi:hypothetical protein [Halomicrobium urmianum]|uniref:hypothetical protein n=1 Tax=Halomicrobium urmianum TaxID=1586233 RepID=UPI001CD921DA|nr:hypothetical protein [Halomicrobium urmianum]
MAENGEEDPSEAEQSTRDSRVGFGSTNNVAHALEDDLQQELTAVSEGSASPSVTIEDQTVAALIRVLNEHPAVLEDLSRRLCERRNEAFDIPDAETLIARLALTALADVAPQHDVVLQDAVNAAADEAYE